MLCALGDLVEDVVVWLDGPPRRGTDTRATVVRHRGGSAANVAAFAAAAGVPSRFIGQVGDDDLGDRLVSALAAQGVEVRVVRRGRTGTVVVLVEPDGERTMLPDRAAATELTDVPRSWLAGVRVLHLPVYSLAVEPLATASIRAAAQVRAAGGMLSVDASSVAVLEAFGPGRARALIERLGPDVLLANAAEADVLGLGSRSIDGIGCVVVKHGPGPVMVSCGDRTASFAVPPIAGVADTTGAGDAFAAGFLAAVLAGAGPFDAAPAGIALATRTLGQPGATLQEVQP